MLSGLGRQVANRWRALSAIVTTCGVLMAPGCDSRGATSVRGVVTLDGKPVEKAIVQFVPERGNAKTAVAVTDRDGRYAIPIAPVPFRVTIVAQRVAGQKKDDANPNGPLIDIHEDVVPSRYSNPESSHLRVEPAEGRANDGDFAMTTADVQR